MPRRASSGPRAPEATEGDERRRVVPLWDRSSEVDGRDDAVRTGPSRPEDGPVEATERQARVEALRRIAL